MEKPAMKRFRVYLKDGVTFTVESERFELDGATKSVKFFRTKDDKEEEDRDTRIRYDVVIAIVRDTR